MKTILIVLTAFLICAALAVSLSSWATVQIEQAQADRRAAEASIAASEATARTAEAEAGARAAEARWAATAAILQRSVDFADEISGELILFAVVLTLVGVIVLQIRLWTTIPR